MADNYLEKRMEDYARGRSTGPRARGAHTPRPGMMTVRYQYRTVVVTGADTDAGAEIVGAFVGAGCLVAFICSCRDAGRTLSQSRGGRFYPGGLAQAAADMAARGEAVDVAVCCGEVPEGLPCVHRLIQVGADISAAPAHEAGVAICGDDARQAAMLCLVLAHPASTVSGQVIRM